MEYQYKLEKYTGPKTKHRCPSCGKTRCFTRYIDTLSGEYLNEKVGACDHLQSCGYYYKPKEYFKDNPNLETNKPKNHTNVFNKMNKKNPICEIDPKYFKESTYSSKVSDFENFLRANFPDSEVDRVKTLYFLGVNKNCNVVYWQVDNKSRIRTGKIMAYDSLTGKRLKEDNLKLKNYNLKIQPLTWVHAELKRNGLLPEEWVLTQCLFGLHLLDRFPKKTVNIVEGEKTAIIMSLVLPNYLWMATGGVEALNKDKLIELGLRPITLFPDVGCYKKWKAKAEEIMLDSRMKITISKLLEDNYKDYGLEEGDDLADLVLSEKLKVMSENEEFENLNY